MTTAYAYFARCYAEGAYELSAAIERCCAAYALRFFFAMLWCGSAKSAAREIGSSCHALKLYGEATPWKASEPRVGPSRRRRELHQRQRIETGIP